MLKVARTSIFHFVREIECPLKFYELKLANSVPAPPCCCSFPDTQFDVYLTIGVLPTTMNAENMYRTKVQGSLLFLPLIYCSTECHSIASSAVYLLLFAGLRSA